MSETLLGCPHCAKAVGFAQAMAGQVVCCPHCDGSFQMPNRAPAGKVGRNMPPHVRARRLSQSLRLIRLRQLVRTALDLLRLGTGTGERLCAALIISAIVFGVVLVASIAGRIETVNALYLAGGTLLGIFIPIAILVLWSSDNSLESNFKQSELELDEARKQATVERAAETTAAFERELVRRQRDSLVRVRCTHCSSDMNVENIYLDRQINCIFCESPLLPSECIRSSVLLQSGQHNCPFCKETIHPEAIKCKHCGEMIGTYTSEAKGWLTRDRKMSGVVGVILLVAVVLACAGLLGRERGPAGPMSESEIQDSAMATSEVFVKEYLKSPASAKFIADKKCERFGGPDEYIVVGSVDSQNGFGATIRSTYGVHMRHDTTKKKWLLVRPPILESR